MIMNLFQMIYVNTKNNMANTIMTAKNTFQDALVMDLTPDNTQATCLSNALNATLVTMNGNELSLQNDMGNGRVETAYLPEGYVPVGTCEFGDIIYIVSYNPLTDKSQIGCFPSPERNISSDELGDTPQTLSDSDFFNEKDGENWVKSNSAKKILCSKALNPGDKFIVYTTNQEQFDQSGSIITDYGNTAHTIYTYPKQLRISLVAIEDNGKINYLDSTLKWYDRKSLIAPTDRDYYINSEQQNSTQNVDIDSYRDLLNSGYSVFQSKVSGKLAILAELERIDGFDCTYDVYKVKSEDISSEGFTFNGYKIYINCSWDTDNEDINPSTLKIHDIKWISNRKDAWAGCYQRLTTDNPDNGPTQVVDIEFKPYNINISTPLNYHLDKGLDYKSFIQNYNFSALTKDLNLQKVSQYREDGIPECGYYLLDVTSYQKDSDGLYNYYDSANNIVVKKEIDDITINNFYKATFYKAVSTCEYDVKIPNTQTVNGIVYNVDKQDLILQFTTTPKMEYGYLPDLSVINQIDFSKIGTGIINLNTYKYYIGENLCTLMLGTEIYPEEGKGVEEIVLEFYDTQGICAAYHINDRQSYSGIMTEQIPLNGTSTNYKLSNYDAYNQLFVHAGVETTETENVVYLKNGIPTTEVQPNSKTYLNDAGTLYSNLLYAVKIVVKYKSKNILGQYDATDTKDYKSFWRWMWTNTVFNEYYTTVRDFKDNQLKLDLDIATDYQSAYNSTTSNYGYGTNTDSTKLYEGLGTKVEHLNGNIQCRLRMGLQNTYNTFTLIGDIDKEDGVYKESNIDIYLGKSYFSDDSSLIYYNNVLLSDNNLLTTDLTNQYDLYKQNYISSEHDLYEDGKTKYQPIGKINFNSQNLQTADISYISSQTNTIETINCPYISGRLLDFNDYNNLLNIDIYNPSNYLYLFIQAQTQCQIIKSLFSDYTKYGIEWNDAGYFEFTNQMSLWTSDCYHGNDKRQYIIKLKNGVSITDAATDVMGDCDWYTEDAKLKGGEWDNESLVKNRYGCVLCGHQGSNVHSQFKNNNCYILNQEIDRKHDTAKEENFTIGAWNNGFFQHYTPAAFSTNNKNKYFLYNCKNNSLRKSAQLGFKDDNGLHLFNYFSDWGTPREGNSTKLVTFVLQWMLQTFYLSQDVEYTQFNKFQDIIYRKGQVIFTQDLIYKASVKTPDLVTIQGFNYTNYKEQILNRINTKDLTKDDSNVLIEFNDIQKTLPIQFSLNYQTPTIPDENIAYIVKSEVFDSNETNAWDTSQVTTNKLYQINTNDDGSKKLIVMGNNQQIRGLQQITKEDNTYKFILQEEDFLGVTMTNALKFDNYQLVAKNSDAVGKDTYGIQTNCGNGDCFFGDFILSETLVANGTTFNQVYK